MRSKQFGGKLSQDWIRQYEQSPHWQSGEFRNLFRTAIEPDWRSIPGILYRQIKGHNAGTPSQPLAIQQFDKSAFLQETEKAKFIWYGHSVILMRLQNQTILIDPMLGGNASPIAPIKTKRFSDNTLALIDDLPEIDLIVLTHDHYDHLDFDSIQKLKGKTKRYFVALGIKRHLIAWGVDKDLITEFDWWQTQPFENMHISFTPTQHSSGRGLSSLAKCLWGGWVFKTDEERIWFSGDGGYGAHFVEIGKQFGTFDLAFMECGQYNHDWHQLHLFPNESVQAACDAQARAAMPIHWAGFKLSYQHAWYEPPTEFLTYAHQRNLPVLTPQLGEIFSVDSTTHKWWEALI